MAASGVQAGSIPNLLKARNLTSLRLPQKSQEKKSSWTECNYSKFKQDKGGVRKGETKGWEWRVAGVKNTRAQLEITHHPPPSTINVAREAKTGVLRTVS